MRKIRSHAQRWKTMFLDQNVQYMFVAKNAPHRAIVVSNRSGKYQLHAVDFTTGFERQLTRMAQGTLFGSISPDGQYVYILNDNDGSEHGHFIRLSFDGGIITDVTPNIERYFSYSISSSDDNKTLCFSAASKTKNKVHTSVFDKRGKWVSHELHATQAILSEPVCSPDGKFVCVAETNPGTKGAVLLLLSAVPNASLTIRSRKFAAITPLAFSSMLGNSRVLALARIKNWYRPVIYDFENKRTLEIRHRLFRGDVWVLRRDESLERLILCEVYKARQTLYAYDIRTRMLKRIGPRTGSFNLHFNSVAAGKDGNLIFRWQDFNTSSRLIKVHPSGYGAWKEISEWSGIIKTKYSVKDAWTHSSDSARVHLRAVRPFSSKKPIPFIIEAHGGPHGVVGDEFSPEAQTWLANGFGYCAVNYRGSISFGKEFERKIYGNPGKWEVEDIVAARNWLVKNKYADPKEVTLYGWSWGGFVTLLALGKYPRLWNGGVTGAGITDCVMQYEDEPAYFKAQDKERFKGTPETARSRYIRSSPVHYADCIQAPTLILHGKNDARCPPRQIRHFVDILKKLKKQVSITWFVSGHTGEFTATPLRIKLMGKALRFVLSVRGNKE